MSSWADSLPGQLLSLLWVWLSSMAGQLSMERLGDCILELHRPCSRQTCPHTVQTPPPPLSTAPSLPQRQQTVDVQEHRSFNICKQSITLSPLSLSLALSLSLSLSLLRMYRMYQLCQLLISISAFWKSTTLSTLLTEARRPLQHRCHWMVHPRWSSHTDPPGGRGPTTRRHVPKTIGQ